jgi:hypothetical protein
MLPALLALKGILMLASAGTSIANLAKAIGLMVGAKGVADTPLAKLTKNGLLQVAVKYAIPLAITFASLSAIDTWFSDPKNRTALAHQGQSITQPSKFVPKAVNGVFVDKNGYDSSGNFVGVPGQQPNSSSDAKPNNNNNIINIIVQSADPKAVVDAVGKYVKTNGGLPSSWGTNGYHSRGH